MKSRASLVATVAAGALLLCARADDFPSGQNWTNYVRIAAFPLQTTNAEKIVKSATADHVFGIEVDNDIPGRYESFVNPEEKLNAIRRVAAEAHRVANYAFVYIAGTECITANADQAAHSMAKDHPDWLQRDINGKPALFGGGTAFWIKKGDEDVWISPFAAEWRKIYMQRVRQIAETGIDGIYVDIPYWMTHFEGWENSWASFDDATVRAFRDETGLDAKKDLKLGDFSDTNFRKWVDFRIRALTDFMADIAKNAKSVNPKIMTIPEIYPGIEEEAVRVGADVYQMYAVVDAIAHEYEFGEGNHMAVARSQLDWFKYMVGWSSFRAFANGKATWMLNYSWDGDKNVAPPEPMKNLFMAEIMAGVNVWDAAGHVMSGSNDLPTRRAVFLWIAEHERTFYAPRSPMHPVGVYFSPATRNYFTKEFLNSYQGIVILLLQHHMEYQVVTPRTLAKFRGEILILPDVRVLSEDEKKAISSYAASGGKLVIAGENATGLDQSTSVAILPNCPGKAHMAAIERDMNASDAASEHEFWSALAAKPEIEIEAPPLVATQIARVEGKPYIFFANFTGLVPSTNAKQTPVSKVKIHVVGHDNRLVFLPFLGEARNIEGQRGDRGTVFELPAIDKGAVAWIENKQPEHGSNSLLH